MTRVITTKSKIFWQVLLYFAIGFLFGFVTAKVWFARPTEAKITHTQWSEWADTSACIPNAECGTTEGLKSQERVCELGGDSHECNVGSVTPAHWDYADPICPLGYHVQNSGNWNQRCHRNFNWMHPEHKAPIGCPAGFSQSGADCRKWVEEVVVPADKETREIKCEVELVECEQEPTPTPTPTEEPKHELTPAGPPSLPSCELITWAPSILEVGRIDSDSVFAKWSELKEADEYLVWYGTEEGNLPWNVRVADEYVELNEVPNTHIWLKVAGVDNDCVGPFSIVTDP